MDSITHTILGACIGEAVGGRKLGKKAMVIGALANNFPDIDVVSSFWMTHTESFVAHRGFTHSILFASIVTFVAGWAMKHIFRKSEFSKIEWYLLIGINLFVHLLVDVITAYGTGLFEPFSHDRIVFHLLFVADPFFTLPLLVSLIALLFLKTHSSKRKTWAFIGLTLSSVYCCYALFHKIRVNKAVEHSLTEQKMVYQKFMATPTPLNNFLWYIAVDRDTGYSIGYYSVFDHSPNIRFHYVPKKDYLLPKNDDDTKNLIRFSQGYYTADVLNDTLVFHDLRFGQIGGWFSGNAPFVFQYRLHPTTFYEVPFQRERIKASGGIILKEMIERIKGI